MKPCIRCGKLMLTVQDQVSKMETGIQWDEFWWCGCGYTEFKKRVKAATFEDGLRSEWEMLNRERADQA